MQGGHELASLYSLKFLEAFLTNKQKSREFLEKSLSEDSKKHIDTSFVKKAILKIPDITLIKDAYNSSGFQYIDSLYRKQKIIDNAPFSQIFYADMKDWLAWQKDPEFNDRYQLYKLAYDSYPNSAEVNYYLSYFAFQTRQNEESRFHIKKALDILEKNGNPELTVHRKEKLKSSLIEILSNLTKY